MKFDGRVRELGPVDCQALKDKVLSLDDEWWNLDISRQKNFDVHVGTRSIVMLFCEGWPNVQIKKRDAWDLLAAEATPLVQYITRTMYAPGGTTLRAMVAKMPPGGTIPSHRDKHPSFGIGHRIHVPLKTNDDVVFNVDGERQKMNVGEAYEINNLLLHEVFNHGDEDRLHFIFDYVPPKKTGNTTPQGTP